MSDYCEAVLDVLCRASDGGHDIDTVPDGLCWDTHRHRFLVNCNDFFNYATADAEIIEPEDLPLLEQAWREAFDSDLEEHQALWLFAVLKRKMLPAGLDAFPPALRTLFAEATG